MRSDTDLLLAYSRHSDVSAFAELVNRRVGLVYGCALRLTNGSTLAAEEATQDVFRTLARKAGQAAQSRAVVGWLYTTTRYAAANAVRASRRRRRWESEAHVMHEIERPGASDESWRELRPVLDRALGSLSRLDRDLVLLRFFEGRPFDEIGRAFALSGDAARLRIERALERMRAALRRAGIQSTTAALAAALANEAAAAAPAGLAASVSAGALVPAASAGAGALTLMAIYKPM